ncbi:MAG: recombinase family protein [Oscillospiraceae bacterium]|nr:recombinase family protein [Oscillospiraceae bacterium]
MDNHNNLKPNLKTYAHLFDKLSSGKPIWLIGPYVRLSKEDGNSVSLSIVNQIKMIARALRTFDDFRIVDIYIDDGKTGTDFDRSDYVRLEQDIFGKQVNCMMVKDLNRYSRNIADGIKALDDFVLTHKLRFISLGIPEIDTYKDPTAISSAEVYGALNAAEDFARTTSKKVRAIKAIKREDGEKNGGHPPYGYLPNPNGENWLYDPVAGEIVKQMFAWSASGMSDRAIVKKLNLLGIPNPTAYKKSIGLKYYNPNAEKNSGLWWPATVKRILEDKTNIGYSVQGKSSSFDHKRHKQIPNKKEDYVIVADRHERAVSDELFETVIQARSARTRVSNKTGVVHLFAGLVYCSGCNLAMKKTSAKGHEYLVCRTYREAGAEHCTGKRGIRFDVLEDIVLTAIQAQVALIADLQSVVEGINGRPEINKQSIRINQLLESCQREFERETNLLDSSYYDWKNGDISREQYQRIREESEKRLEQIRATLQMLAAERQKAAQGIGANNEYFERFLKYQNVEALDRLMLVEMIERIYVHEDKSVKVEFNFIDQYLRVMDFIQQNTAEPLKLTLEKRNES